MSDATMNRSGGSRPDPAAAAVGEAERAPDALAAVATVAPRRPAAAGGGRAFGAFAGVFLAILLSANAAVGLLTLPDYGAWTGVIEIEQKLRMLEDFARQGPVDTLALSSSLGDHGFSAAALSEELSLSHGRPWRAFNFSTGGADHPTCALLYRLARTVVRPRQVMLIMPADPAYGEKLAPTSPEYFLTQAPVGTVIRRPTALLLSKWFWSAPLVHGAGPLRDYATYGSFKGRALTNTDLYAYSEQGDTLNYSVHVLFEQEGLRRARVAREQWLIRCLAPYSKARSPEDKRRVYLTDRALDGLRDLAALVRQDGARLTLVAHDSSAGYMARDPLYREARTVYYREITRAAGAAVVDVLDAFRPHPYEMADTMHLNVYGARRFARILAARLDGRPNPEAPRLAAPDLAHIDPNDPTFNPWSAVVVSGGAASYRTLEVRVIQSVRTLTLRAGSPVQVILRQPDDSDLTLRAKVFAQGRILCDASRLAPGERVLVARVVSSSTGLAWRLPLAGYRWSTDPFPLDSVGEGKERLHTDVARVKPGQEVRASWRDVNDAAADDWIGLFAEDGPDEGRSEPVPTSGGSSGSAPFEIPPNVPPGRYELRVFGRGGWRRLATSPSFEVLPSTTSVRPVGGPFRAGGTITAAWSGVVSPKPDDWIGVFPIDEQGWPGVASAVTGGAEAGSVRIKVPADAGPGRYELRMLDKDGELRATSPAFRLHRAKSP